MLSYTPEYDLDLKKLCRLFLFSGLVAKEGSPKKLVDFYKDLHVFITREFIANFSWGTKQLKIAMKEAKDEGVYFDADYSRAYINNYITLKAFYRLADEMTLVDIDEFTFKAEKLYRWAIKHLDENIDFEAKRREFKKLL